MLDLLATLIAKIDTSSDEGPRVWILEAEVWVTPSILVGVLFVRAQCFVRSQLFHSGEI